MAVRSKVRVCGRLIARVASWNYAESKDVRLLRLLCVVLIAVSATNRSLIQSSPTGSVCLIVYGLETSKRNCLGSIGADAPSKNYE